MMPSIKHKTISYRQEAIGRKVKDNIFPYLLPIAYNLLSDFIMKRREFLKGSIKVFFSLLAAAVLSVFIYIYPFGIKEKRLKFFYIIDEDDLPKKGVKKIEFKYRAEDSDKDLTVRIFLSAVDGRLTAFSSVCTHLGCLVNWDNNKKEFLCPCHGGRFDINGGVIKGPPQKPLAKLPLEIKEGKVYIGIKA